MKTICLLAFIIYIATISACTPDPNQLILSPEVRYMSDTMFLNRRKLLDQELDSICLIQKEALVQAAVDSLLIIEKRKIEELSE
jgi:hypothetical protein